MTESEIFMTFTQHMDENRMLATIAYMKGHPAWESFTRRMKTRQYGCDALRDAWAWYQTGWSDRKVKP